MSNVREVPLSYRLLAQKMKYGGYTVVERTKLADSPVMFKAMPVLFIEDLGVLVSCNKTGTCWRISHGSLLDVQQFHIGDTQEYISERVVARIADMIGAEIVLDECCDAPFEDFVARAASFG